MTGSNAGTGQPLVLRCGKCRKHRDYKSLAHEDIYKGMNLIRTGRTRDTRRGNTRTLPIAHEVVCLACNHVGWSRHKDVLHKPLAHYVEIVETATNKVERRMGPMTEAKADKVENGALMRVDIARFFVRTGTDEALKKEAAAREAS